MEKRISARFNLNQPIIITSIRGKHNAQILNISTGGCCIISPYPLSTKTNIQIDVLLPGRTSSINKFVAECFIVNVKRTADETFYMMNLQYVQIADNSRQYLAEFIVMERKNYHSYLTKV